MELRRQRRRRKLPLIFPFAFQRCCALNRFNALPLEFCQPLLPLNPLALQLQLALFLLLLLQQGSLPAALGALPFQLCQSLLAFSACLRGPQFKPLLIFTGASGQ